MPQARNPKKLIDRIFIPPKLRIGILESIFFYDLKQSYYHFKFECQKIAHDFDEKIVAEVLSWGT